MEHKRTVLETGWRFIGEDVPGGESVNLLAEGWKTVSLPHDWAVSRPLNREMKQGGPQGFLDRWGIGWYRKNITLEAKNGNAKYLLTFEGVFENCSVYVNEKLCGKHAFGYSGFTLDVTDHLNVGENLIAVRVDNTIDPVDRWYSGAGIYRPVYLEEVHQKAIDPMNVVAKTKFADGLKTAELCVNAGGGEHGIYLFDGETLVASQKGTGEVCVTVQGPKLWNADSPALYRLEVARFDGGEEIDRIEMSYGFREVEWLAQKGFFVNGKMEKLKGICLHQDVAAVGVAVTKSLLRQRLMLFKEIGCNAIRTSHNIPSVDLLDLCDEMGFYVLDESFDKWDAGSYERHFHENWEADLTYMVRRDRNRACVVAWSVGNEVDKQGSAHMLDTLKMLVGAVKALDDRPVTCAMSPHYTDREENIVISVEDCMPSLCAIADLVDIMSLNYQEQWYDEFRKARPSKLILGSETYLFFRGSRDNYFNYSTENPWLDVERNDDVVGGFLWAGVDYLGESMGYPSKGWAGAMVRANHVRKPISWLFESYWSEKPVVHFTVQDYTIRDDMSREHWSFPRMNDCWSFPMFSRSPIPYMIFSNCEEVRLLLNGKKYDIKKPAEYESRIIQGYLPMDAGEVLAEGYNGGVKVCEHRLQTPGLPQKLAFEAPVGISAYENNQQMLLTIQALDKDGKLCARETAEVRFQVEGPCVIEGVDNGDLLNTEPFAADRVHMYQGTAALVIRFTEGSGRVRLVACADGMLPAEYTFIKD